MTTKYTTEISKGKFKILDYAAKDSKCSKKDCFVPFQGNGRPICRLYELGKCKENKADMEGMIMKSRFELYVAMFEDRREMLPPNFNAWVTKNFGNIDNVIREYDIDLSNYYSILPDHDAEDRDKQVIEIVTDEMDRQYDEWLDFYYSLTFPLILYRAINIEAQSIDEIANADDASFYNNVGVYWAHEEEWARVYWGNSTGHSTFIIKAEVNESDINWNETLYTNMYPILGEDEREIRIRENTKIHLVGIKKQDDKEFKQLDFIVKA